MRFHQYNLGHISATTRLTGGLTNLYVQTSMNLQNAPNIYEETYLKLESEAGVYSMEFSEWHSDTQTQTAITCTIDAQELDDIALALNDRIKRDPANLMCEEMQALLTIVGNSLFKGGILPVDGESIAKMQEMTLDICMLVFIDALARRADGMNYVSRVEWGMPDFKLDGLNAVTMHGYEVEQSKTARMEFGLENCNVRGPYVLKIEGRGPEIVLNLRSVSGREIANDVKISVESFQGFIAKYRKLVRQQQEYSTQPDMAEQFDQARRDLHDQNAQRLAQKLPFTPNHSLARSLVETIVHYAQTPEAQRA